MKELFIEDKYLTKESEIVDWFKDCGHEYFDCGQGYYQEDVEVNVKINDDYFKVIIQASIEGSKQDRGDRLYYVDEITNVEYFRMTLEEFKDRVNTDLHSEIKNYEKKIEKLKSQLI